MLKDDIEHSIIVEMLERFGKSRTATFIEEMKKEQPLRGYRYQAIFKKITSCSQKSGPSFSEACSSIINSLSSIFYYKENP